MHSYMLLHVHTAISLVRVFFLFLFLSLSSGIFHCDCLVQMQHCKIAMSIIFTYLLIKCDSKAYYLMLVIVSICILFKWPDRMRFSDDLIRHNEGRFLVFDEECFNKCTYCAMEKESMLRPNIDFTMATKPVFKPWKIVCWTLIAATVHLNSHQIL